MFVITSHAAFKIFSVAQFSGNNFEPPTFGPNFEFVANGGKLIGNHEPMVSATATGSALAKLIEIHSTMSTNPANRAIGWSVATAITVFAVAAIAELTNPVRGCGSYQLEIDISPELQHGLAKVSFIGAKDLESAEFALARADEFVDSMRHSNSPTGLKLSIGFSLDISRLLGRRVNEVQQFDYVALVLTYRDGKTKNFVIPVPHRHVSRKIEVTKPNLVLLESIDL